MAQILTVDCISKETLQSHASNISNYILLVKKGKELKAFQITFT